MNASTVGRPSSLRAYLAMHFIEAAELAMISGLDAATLSALVAARLIPGPSYTVAGSTVTSFVFGERSAADAREGRYFHPATAHWIRRAQRVLAGNEQANAYEQLRGKFATNMRAALAELDRSTWRLNDAFTSSGDAIEPALQDRIDTMWTHLLAGTFGLCVAEPRDECAIARKEILQEKLGRLTDGGSRGDLASIPGVAALMDAFEAASMPFSPAEYLDSSRRRLVDDLRIRLSAHAAGVAASVVDQGAAPVL